MIRSWRGGLAQRVYEGKNPNSPRGVDYELARERLAGLNAATRLEDLGGLRSVGLHKLKGDRKGQWAVNINGPWRICFRFKDGDAYDVEIVDYH